MVKVLLIDWHLYNGPRKIDDVHLEQGGLPNVLPLLLLKAMVGGGGWPTAF